MIAEPDAAGPRWIASGWIVYNNKAKPVRQYEPFFTVTHAYQRDSTVGVTPILCYDPASRVIATVHPDHSWEKVVFDAWRQEAWDRNDTVLIADPAADADIGGPVNLLPATDVRPTWYELRTDPARAPDRAARWPDPRDGAAQAQAAELTAVHAGTPSLVHNDSLGRAVLAVSRNRYAYSNAPAGAPPVEETWSTRTILDIEGQQIQVIDALGRLAMRYDYDVLGRQIHRASMESGERWILMDAIGKPIYTWDSRGHRQCTTYDALRRPASVFLSGPSVTNEITIAQTTYGESMPAPEAQNLRARVAEVRDQAGVAMTGGYDFKGNILRSGRQVARGYDTLLDWSVAVDLLPGTFWQRTSYDALNRPVQEVAPYSDQGGVVVNVVQRSYGEGGLLKKVDTWLELPSDPNALLAPATAMARL